LQNAHPDSLLALLEVDCATLTATIGRIVGRKRFPVYRAICLAFLVTPPIVLVVVGLKPLDEVGDEHAD
jgi:hypothetical protein